MDPDKTSLTETNNECWNSLKNESQGVVIIRPNKLINIFIY